MATNCDEIAGGNDFRIDSARFLRPITVDEAFDCARGIWLSEAAPVRIDYKEEDGTERTGLMIFPGPNLFIVSKVLASSEGSEADMRAIY
jgi:hypothetical protein